MERVQCASTNRFDEPVVTVQCVYQEGHAGEHFAQFRTGIVDNWYYWGSYLTDGETPKRVAPTKESPPG
jgi:hypothetical protein